MSHLIKLSIIVLCSIVICESACAQAKLSFQGILKKSNGVAVEDGTYSLTFKLYTQEVGGTAVWTEPHNDVEVVSGIYSVILGTNVDLDAAFDVPYYLGITIGGNEMVPRFALTSAPYALALQGDTNTFPSTGAVTADQINVQSGNPGSTDPNGYSFGGSGDQDGGMYSSSDGEVTMYINAAKRIEMLPDSTNIYGNLRVHGTHSIDGNLKADNIVLNPGGKIRSNGLDEWQLVDVDNFNTDTEGWNTYIWGSPIGTGGQSGSVERQNSSLNPFVGWWIRGSGTSEGNGYLLKKEFNLQNIPHSEVMVEFTYLVLGSWNNEFSFGGFATTLNTAASHSWSEANVLGLNFEPIDDQTGSTDSRYDKTIFERMFAEHSDNTITVFFGAALNENQNNESWGISNVKVYVR